MLLVSDNKCILFSLLIWARIVEFGLFDLNKVILKEECDFFIEQTVNLKLENQYLNMKQLNIDLQT